METAIERLLRVVQARRGRGGAADDLLAGDGGELIDDFLQIDV